MQEAGRVQTGCMQQRHLMVNRWNDTRSFWSPCQWESLHGSIKKKAKKVARRKQIVVQREQASSGTDCSNDYTTAADAFAAAGAEMTSMRCPVRARAGGAMPASCAS